MLDRLNVLVRLEYHTHVPFLERGEVLKYALDAWCGDKLLELHWTVQGPHVHRRLKLAYVRGRKDHPLFGDWTDTWMGKHAVRLTMEYLPFLARHVDALVPYRRSFKLP